MLIKEFTIEPFLIDSICLRKGILLTVKNQNNEVAKAEISPLPGYSIETLDDAMNVLRTCERKVLTTWWSIEALTFLDSWQLPPSVFFGLKSALLDLLDPIKCDPPCKTYALLFGGQDEILIKAQEAKAEGFQSAKVKLGHFSINDAKSLIDSLSSLFTLRLDFNRQWSLDKAIEFCSHYPQEHFEYIEEPCSNPEELHFFPYPFALDETLQRPHDLEPYLSLKMLKALIIKPTLIYPFDHLLKLGKNVVFTSSFEGKVGIGQIKRMINRLGMGDTAHGLDTLRYMETDPYDENMPGCVLEKA